MTKSIFQKLPHENVWVRIGVSSIHGVGVIAIRNIPAKTIIFPGKEKKIWIHASIIKKLKGETRKLYEDFCIERQQLYGCPKSFNKISPDWYLNHSNKPNVAFDKKLNAYALRIIKKGDELTVDYNVITEAKTKIRKMTKKTFFLDCLNQLKH